MKIPSFLFKIFAYYIHKKNKKWIENPLFYQEKTLKSLIKKAKKTKFGKDHHFKKIFNYEDFKKRVPVRDYEGLKNYIDLILSGEKNILWKNKPLYLSKTSGTTSGVKYIPITSDSISTHIRAARDAIFNYIYETGNYSFIGGKQIFLQGSPVLEQKNGIFIGRLSGIVAHHMPFYLKKNRAPSWKANCIEDWEKKVKKIAEETLKENMTVISGIPPWVQMYFEELIKIKKKPVGKIFKNFSLFVYGGVNFEPYRLVFKKLIGRSLDTIEVFPASEGFFAYQNNQNEKDLLLLVNSDIFYEFIDVNTFFNEKPSRISLKDVKKGVNYVLIISSSAGLWSYNVGDTVIFTSIKPYKLIISGRLKHFISAFGEHVITKEVETAIKETLKTYPALINEFTVAPQVNPSKGLPYHEWFIEFEKVPENISSFEKYLDKEMQKQNIYYKDLIEGKILKTLRIKIVPKKSFQKYMSSQGKLGGQNKVPRLSNDRKIAKILSLY